MKKLTTSAMMFVMLSGNGCYQSQRSIIDASYQQETSKLDVECHEKMDRWCEQKYQSAEKRHDDAIKADDQKVSSGQRDGAIITVVVLATTGLVVGGIVAAKCSHGAGC